MSYTVWRKYNVSLTELGAELFLLVLVRLLIVHLVVKIDDPFCSFTSYFLVRLLT